MVKVFLWSAPRSISTAFERSIRELKDTKVFHIPYAKCYYYGPDRQSLRYIDTPIDTNATYEVVNKQISKEYDGFDHIFAKNMAYVICNHFDELMKKDLKSFRHTFLIRSPLKSIISLYKVSIDKELAGWDYFDPDQAGFKQMWKLFQFLKEDLNEEPVVVDADDLLTNPEGTMQAYCNATGLPFDLNMVKWKPGPINDWNACNGFHDTVLKSSGFEKRDPEQLQVSEEDIKTYPKEVQLCIEESLTYNQLKSHKLNPQVKN